MMNDVAIIRSNRLNMFGDSLNGGIKVYGMFDFTNKIRMLETEFKLHFHRTLSDSCFNDKLRNISEETIIVFDGHVRKEFLVWLRKLHPNKRIILWLWNTVDEIEKNFNLNDVPMSIEVWSYSKYDCEKNGYNYNTTFFWKTNGVKELTETNSEIFFIGKDKGRYEKIKSFEEKCSQLGVVTDFNIVPTYRFSFPMQKKYSKKMNYSEIENRIEKTKAILDIKVQKHAGPSLRAVESAFFKKKLITDDTNVKSFKFYNKNNIFIIGEDKYDDLNYFLNSPFEEVSLDNLYYYDVNNWVDRFF
ncbi:Uncharacterised protein [Streptococcus equinus]|uniref:hypothetical protein n=1 Tax=Streptococcus equinus TaxID=1335 RepID=UPI000F6EC418|nr:hypothetical protein [Streptococcus equinus]VED91392.1 Uncharacterised protein [Streptococcus equinus]VTS85126.1 Uncharacterised protein [Streptococcus equinus]